MWIVKIKTWDGADAGTEYIGPFPFREMAEIALKHFRTLNTVTKSKVVGLSGPSSLMEYDDFGYVRAKPRRNDPISDAYRRDNMSVAHFCEVAGISPSSSRISQIRYVGFLEGALDNLGGEHPDYTKYDYEEDESVVTGETYVRRLARELLDQHRAEYGEGSVDLLEGL